MTKKETTISASLLRTCAAAGKESTAAQQRAFLALGGVVAAIGKHTSGWGDAAVALSKGSLTSKTPKKKTRSSASKTPKKKTRSSASKTPKKKTRSSASKTPRRH